MYVRKMFGSLTLVMLLTTGAVAQAAEAPKLTATTLIDRAMIEDLPAAIVMADIAYDSDQLRQVNASKGAISATPKQPVVPTRRNSLR